MTWLDPTQSEINVSVVFVTPVTSFFETDLTSVDAAGDLAVIPAASPFPLQHPWDYLKEEPKLNSQHSATVSLCQ